MTRSDVFSNVSEIFVDVMDLDEADLEDTSSADDFEEWDSLSHVRLVVAVEREFGVKFTNAEIESMKCVGDLVDTIMAKAA